jgi:hypothetical protein
MIEVDHEYYVIELEKLIPELVTWLNKSFGPPGPRWWISYYNIKFNIFE